MVSVADCERVQTNWFRAQAEAHDGAVWTDGGMLWTDGPDGLNVMFPAVLDPAALDRGVRHAREAGRGIVGAWLGLDVDPEPLAAAGFQRGWAPWWMTAELADVPVPADPRVRQAPPDRAGVWAATAHLPPDDLLAGRAFSFLDGDLAGIFDMEVWPRFQRRGLGTGLLATVCAAAAAAGARHAVLNATPEGKQLYSRHGFHQIGEGITWWHHLAAG